MLKRDLSPVSLLIAVLLPLSLAEQQMDRSALPVPEPQPPTITELDARNAKAPPRFEVKAPKGAPTSLSFCWTTSASDNRALSGGPAKMPRSTNWQPRACATTTFIPRHFVRRLVLALLTGRNHHVNNAGAIMELATAFPATPAFVRKASRR